MNVAKVLEARAKFKNAYAQVSQSNISDDSWIKREEYGNAFLDLAVELGLRSHGSRTPGSKDRSKISSAIAELNTVKAEYNKELTKLKAEATAGKTPDQIILKGLKSKVIIAEDNLEIAQNEITSLITSLQKMAPLINEKLKPIIPTGGKSKSARSRRSRKVECRRKSRTAKSK